MSFILKLVSAMLIISIIYILAVFFLPNQTDSLAKNLWIYSLNLHIRNLKNWSLTVSDKLLQIKSWEEIVGKVGDMANQANSAINTTKNIISTKIDQTNKVIKSWEKVIDATNEFKNSVSNLSSMSWSEK